MISQPAFIPFAESGVKFGAVVRRTQLLFDVSVDLAATAWMQSSLKTAPVCRFIAIDTIVEEIRIAMLESNYDPEPKHEA